MTIIHDLTQAYQTCGAIKQVWWEPNPSLKSGQRKRSKKLKALSEYNNKLKVNQSDYRVP